MRKKELRIDIGCGMPEDKYKGCIGIDINPNCHPDILCDVQKGIPLKDNSVAFINSDNSLEHTKNPYFVLQEMYRVLDKDGEVRLVVPNCQYFPLIFINMVWDLYSFWEWYMNLSFKRGRGLHWHLFTKGLIMRMCQDVGFKVLDYKGNLYSKEIELRLEK